MKKIRLLVIILFFLFLTQIIIFVVNRESWFDVAFSLQTAHDLNKNGLSSIDFRHYDVHPPTFYMMLALWERVPHWSISEYHWGQELTVLFGVVFLIFVGLTLFEIFGDRGLMATFLLSLCTTYLHYGTEVRMYSLVLALSAIVAYAVLAKELEGNWLWVGSFGVFVLPMVHYFGAMALFFFAAMYVVFGWCGGRFEKKRLLVFFVIGLLGVAWALTYAIPQKERGSGTWFAPPSPDEWPSAVMYSFFMTDLFIPTGLLATAYMVLYVGFGVFLVWLGWQLFCRIGKRMEKEDVVLIGMMATGLFPLMGLLAAPVFGLTSFGAGFGHLYHHRFFLVVTWMFAAGAFIILLRTFDLLKKYIAFGVFVVVLVVLFGMQFIYCTQIVHHELEHLMEATPCPRGDEVGIQIAHESAFSSLPYEVYARENGCKWRNFISTNLTVLQGNVGGYDAVPKKDVYYDLGLPAGDYYMVYAAGIIPVDGVPRKVAVEDGVELWFVQRLKVYGVGWRMVSSYDDDSRYQYTNVSWVNVNGSQEHDVLFPMSG